MAPSSSCAWLVIPTVAVSPSARTHSCSLVYRKFSGYILFGSFVKRSFHGHRIHGLVTDHDLNRLAGMRVGDRQITEPDVLTQAWRGRTAGYPSRRRALDPHFVAVAADAPAAHFEAHQLAFEGALLL